MVSEASTCLLDSFDDSVEIQRKRKCSAFDNQNVIFQLLNRLNYQNLLGKNILQVSLAPINVLRTRLSKVGVRVLL